MLSQQTVGLLILGSPELGFGELPGRQSLGEQNVQLLRRADKSGYGEFFCSLSACGWNSTLPLRLKQEVRGWDRSASSATPPKNKVKGLEPPASRVLLPRVWPSRAALTWGTVGLTFLARVLAQTLKRCATEGSPQTSKRLSRQGAGGQECRSYMGHFRLIRLAENRG